MNVRALVTGAAGFVAANLARRLVADGYDVTLAVRPGSNRWRLEGVAAPVREVELSDAAAVTALVEATQPEQLFHLAAHGAYSTQKDLSRIVAANLVGTMNVVNAAAAIGCRHVVCAGSSSEYGFKDHAPSEDELVEPNSDYAVTKAAATLFGGFAARRSGMRVTTLRLYSVYGPFEEPSRLIPQLLLHALHGALPPLADARIARDFIYIDDVVDAFLAAANATRGPLDAVYNVGSGTQSDLGEIVAIARERFAVAAEPVWGTMAPRSWDTTVWSCNNSRIRAQLGWMPRTELRRGLSNTMAWLQRDAAMLARYQSLAASPPRS